MLAGGRTEKFETTYFRNYSRKLGGMGQQIIGGDGAPNYWCIIHKRKYFGTLCACLFSLDICCTGECKGKGDLSFISTSAAEEPSTTRMADCKWTEAANLGHGHLLVPPSPSFYGLTTRLYL